MGEGIPQKVSFHHLFTANVYDGGCKRLRWQLQTFAGKVANVCGEKMVKRHLLWNPFPHVFLLSPKKTDPATEINRQLGQVFSCPSTVIGRKQYYMRFLFSITSSLCQKDAEPSYSWVLSTLLGYCRQSTLCEVEHGVAINTRSHPIWSLTLLQYRLHQRWWMTMIHFQCQSYVSLQAVSPIQSSPPR